MNRRFALRLFCVFSAAMVATFAIAQSSETLDPVLAKEPLRFVSKPYLQSPISDALTVMWLVNKPCVGWVEYGEGTALDRKAMSSHFGLVDAGEDLCKIPLTGLKPGTLYSYRAVAKEIVRFMPYEVTYGETVLSETYQFTTPSPATETVSFVVFNDIHSSEKLRALLFPVARQVPFDIAFLNGDIMTAIHNREQVINHLAIPFAELCGGMVPFVLIRGNHDTRGYYARELMDYIDTPKGQYCYAFDRGPVRFVVMDSGEDKTDDHKEYSGLVDFARYRAAELEWLKSEVESDAFKRAAFRVGLVHMPLYRKGGQAEAGTEAWGPILNAAKMDVLISGHLHAHEILEPAPGLHDYPIVIGGGSDAKDATVIRGKATRTELEITILDANGERLLERMVQRRE